MNKFLKKISTDQHLAKYALVATALVLLVFYDRAGRHKNRALSGPLRVEVRHMDNGNDFVTSEEMRNKVIKKFQSEFSGIPLSRLSPGTIEAELSSLEFIKSADVFIDANHSLNIFVTQREPIMRVLTPEGYSLYVDREGTTMPASLHYSPRVLVAFASVPRIRDTLQIHQSGMEQDLFNLAIKIMDDRILNALIEEIIVDDLNQWTMVPKLGPSRIYIGDLDMLDEKIESLKKFYKNILPVEGWDKYSTINLKYQGQVICTKKT